MKVKYGTLKYCKHWLLFISMLQLTTIHLTKHNYSQQNYGSSKLTQQRCFFSNTNINSKFNLKISEYYVQIYLNTHITNRYRLKSWLHLTLRSLSLHRSKVRSWS